MSTFVHIVTPENAPRIREWFATRGGIAVWSSADLSDPAWSCTTPLRGEDGAPTPKPHWKASTPPTAITDRAFVGVTSYEEVRRFRVALRRGAQGLKIKLTDHSSAKLRAALDKAGDGAVYQFDYEDQQAVILAPTGTVPL